MSSSYSSKLRDARWQRKRLEVMERDKWTCRSCGASGEGVTLNVHHAYYESGKDPWDYPDDTLVTWCEDCHKERHDLQILILRKLNNATLSECRILCTNPLPVFLMSLPEKVVLLLSEAVDMAMKGGEQ